MRTMFFVSLMALSASGLGAQSSLDGSSQTDAGGCALLVRLRVSSPAPDLSLARVADEVRAIWAPYLTIRVIEGEAPVLCADELRVVIDDAASDADDALGWIHFVGGRPSGDAMVSLARARRLVNDAFWMGRALPGLPRAMSARLLSQAVGRATAHEVGHYVLRTPLHAHSGLMRPGLSAEDAVRPRGARFDLPGGRTRQRLQ